MTTPVALAAFAGFLAVVVLLGAPHAPRLLRTGTTPDRPRRYWVTLVVLREVGAAGAGVAAAWAAMSELRFLPAAAAGAAAGALVHLAAHVVAHAVGLLLPDAVAERLERRVHAFLAPLRRPLERPAVLLGRALAGEAGFAPASVLRFQADGAVGEDEEAALDDRGRALLARVRALRQRPVRAVMTPRVRVAALDADLAGPALRAALDGHRFSRLPVYRGDRDNVIGVLYAKDLLARDPAAPGFRLEALLRPPVFVPVGMRAGDVFRELRRRKVHVAMVVDEYGGIAGLVTMEDLLEELFGEIRDEYDRERPA